MPFRLPEDAKPWFSDVAGHLAVDFDMYYLCLVASLARGGRVTSVTAKGSHELVDYFPGPYKEHARLIIGTFVGTVLSTLGIDLSDRAVVHREIGRLVDPMAPSQLSDHGMKLMNQMAAGGLDVLTEEMEDRPRHIESFLGTYRELINRH